MSHPEHGAKTMGWKKNTGTPESTRLTPIPSISGVLFTKTTGHMWAWLSIVMRVMKASCILNTPSNMKYQRSSTFRKTVNKKIYFFPQQSRGLATAIRFFRCKHSVSRFPSSGNRWCLLWRRVKRWARGVDVQPTCFLCVFLFTLSSCIQVYICCKLAAWSRAQSL